MNAAVVLIVLLLAVPLQLFLSHYIQQVYLESAASNHMATGRDASKADHLASDNVVNDQELHGERKDNLETIRADAMDRLEERL